MNEEIIDKQIKSASSSTPVVYDNDTEKAYEEGARMMYEFLLFNKHLLTKSEIDNFRHLISK